MTYCDFVREEAKKIGTDGCSGVIDLWIRCCWEHDLSYWHGRDPRDAYLRYLQWDDNFWEVAAPITRAEADKRFRQCIPFTVAAWVRWAGVRVGGWKAWRAHRKARP